ncbi:alkaline phosphatase D family protein [Novosphingobium sp. B 225]|uniref:alkaline phosphatase D family protein n=1 Tax=Novosphingobium sp. B 225 TaxID=1961849 RepID=UPI000B4AE7FB|nr:alkaline phosphatase D family protein [Novosphingobium sp. B 225]
MSLPPPAPAPLLATDRRSLFKLGAVGLMGFSAPLRAAVGGGFSHGVASGEPGPDRVLLWTRYASGSDTALKWELSDSEDFARVTASGDCTASPANDSCAKAWAKGLEPGKWYFYRFIAPNGEKSITGRTRTLPVGKVGKFRIAVFSCSNLGFGWFNAYAHACEAGDFDLTMHLGDYFYEYKRGEYPSAKQTLEGRFMPENEATTLAGYRERLATYRLDPDLQRLHQLWPMVPMWDDHEVANDTWAGGAENHQPDEGDWPARKAASEQAYREWLPVSDDYWASYEIGDLATLFKLESRHVGRVEALDFLEVYKGAAPDAVAAALTRFRDGPLHDPRRTLLGAQQEAWLAGALKASTRARKPWQVLGQQVIMGELKMTPKVLDGMDARSPEWLKTRIQASVAAGLNGVPLNMDMWDGYPAARDRLLKSALEANANLVVLSGDSHNAWAFDLDRKGQRVGVEMAGQGVTSPGAEDSLRWIKPDELARESVAANRQLKWCDTRQRGYMAVELTPKSATSEWRFMATVRQRSTALSGVKRMTVLAGQRKYSV